MTRWTTASTVSPRTWLSIRGEAVALPDRQHLVHLQFRRFAGCPVCDLHLRTTQRRHAEIVASCVREVVLFHSSAEALCEHGADALPFAVIADPEKQLYREFGVEAAPRALLDPRAWLTIIRAVATGMWLIVCGKAKPPALRPGGGRLGLPADFLIASDGRVLACKYGENAYDQWSVDELLAHRAAALTHAPREVGPSGEVSRA